MAIQTPITPFHPNEVARETLVSVAFPALMVAVGDLIVAERDLADVSYSQDPAYSEWMRDAELAHERLTDALRAFHSLRLEVPDDRPLMCMAHMIDAMLGHEEPQGARRLLHHMNLVFFTKLQVPGIGATAFHRNGLLIQARSLVIELVALPLFDGAADNIHEPVVPEEVQTAAL